MHPACGPNAPRLRPHAPSVRPQPSTLQPHPSTLQPHPPTLQPQCTQVAYAITKAWYLNNALGCAFSVQARQIGLQT